MPMAPTNAEGNHRRTAHHRTLADRSPDVPAARMAIRINNPPAAAVTKRDFTLVVRTALIFSPEVIVGGT